MAAVCSRLRCEGGRARRLNSPEISLEAHKGSRRAPRRGNRNLIGISALPARPGRSRQTDHTLARWGDACLIWDRQGPCAPVGFGPLSAKPSLEPCVCGAHALSESGIGLEKLYDVVVAPETWPDVLHEITRSANGVGACLAAEAGSKTLIARLSLRVWWSPSAISSIAVGTSATCADFAPGPSSGKAGWGWSSTTSRRRQRGAAAPVAMKGCSPGICPGGERSASPSRTSITVWSCSGTNGRRR